MIGERRIVDYVLVQEELHMLEGKVKEKIEEGYQPHGSLLTGKTYFIQPMVKYKKIDPLTTRK